jgi:DNA mismatch repair ATPase MutS
LLEYNIKLRGFENEILYLAQSIVKDILEVIKSNVSCIFNIINAIATLDMLLAFSNFSLQQGMTVQPVILEPNQKDLNSVVIRFLAIAIH